MPPLFGESGRSGFQLPPTLTFGVWGDAKDGVGVLGTTNNFDNAGVWGDNPGGPNEDNTATGVGVRGTSTDGYGVFGSSTNNVGVLGTSETATGVQGSSTSNAGVRAFSESGWGLITETFTGVALLVIGHLEVQGDAVGQSILQAGQTEVTVTTPAATAVSNVLLTPLANPCGQLWVTRAAGSFTIQASEAPTSDVPIAYLIIN